MVEIINVILSVLLVIILLWFTYTIFNISITIFKTKKQDKSLRFCFNTTGKIVYSLSTILYIMAFFGGLAAIIYGYINNNDTFMRNGLNVAAFMSVVFGFFLSGIVLIGKKNIMVGRMIIDYRKLKKVNFTYDNKMSFVYAQKDYNFSTRFVDKTELRKKISR